MDKANQLAARLESEIKTLDNEIELYQQNMVKSLRELEQSKRAEIVEDIRKCLRKRAAAEGYLYVFDSSGRTMNEQPALLVYPDACDITGVVIEELNRTAVPHMPPPPPLHRGGK